MDLATLGLAVDSRQLLPAVNHLDSLTTAAGRAEKAADSFAKEADQASKSVGAANKGVGSLTQQLDQQTKSATASASSFSQLRSAMSWLTGIVSVTALKEMADTWSDISARVGLAIGDMDGAGDTMDRLSVVARRTYSSLTLTSEGFIANQNVLRELGKTTEEALDFTESLNLALVVSGARAERAAMVQDALSKAMALGKLSGDQLNTVISSGGRVAQALAEQLGVNVNQLRQVGAAGQITGDVIFTALTSRMETLRAEAELMPATLGDAFTLLGNKVLETVGKMDQATGASAALATGLIMIADDATILNATLSVLGVTVLLAIGPTIWTGVASALTAAVASVRVMTGALQAMLAVFLNPKFLLIAVTIAGIAYATGTADAAMAAFETTAENVVATFEKAQERFMQGGKATKDFTAELDNNTVALAKNAGASDLAARSTLSFSDAVEKSLRAIGTSTSEIDRNFAALSKADDGARAVTAGYTQLTSAASAAASANVSLSGSFGQITASASAAASAISRFNSASKSINISGGGGSFFDVGTGGRGSISFPNATASKERALSLAEEMGLGGAASSIRSQAVTHIGLDTGTAMGLRATSFEGFFTFAENILRLVEAGRLSPKEGEREIDKAQSNPWRFGGTGFDPEGALWPWLKGDSLADVIASSAKFQRGGSFTVPGSGGGDRVVPIFRTTPGETVTVSPKGERKAPEINVTMYNTFSGPITRDQVRQTETQLRAAALRAMQRSARIA